MGRTRSRRKAGVSSFTGQNSSVSSGTSTSSSLGSTNTCTSDRRITPEEAALTAKNYRLAKELNELRSRHRDETKNVTKLTMENMNLATRCREAINHVDILRKKLTMQQKLNAEFIASGKTQARSNSESPTFSLAIGGEEFSEKDSNLFLSAALLRQRLPAQDNLVEKVAIENNFDRSSTDNISSPPSEMLFEDLDSGTTDALLDSTTLQQSPQGSPSSAIQKPPGSSLDTAFGDLQSEDFFQTSYKNTLPATPESEFVKKNDKPFLSETERLMGNASENGSIGEGSNIDAFEASFSTTFPMSFKLDGIEGSLPASEMSSVTESFLDPFFTDSSGGSKDEKRRSRLKSGELKKVVRGKSPSLSPRRQLQSRNRQLSSNKKKNKHIDYGRALNVKSKTEEGVDLFPESAMKTFEEITVSTPPTKKKPLNDSGASFNKPPPPPSEKSGLGAARARYDAAYGENKEDILQSVTTGCEDSEHSPTLVLKRLQQRKAKEKINSTPPDVPSTAEALSKSISDEIKKLDKIAISSSVGDPPPPPPPDQTTIISKRRNVKQPISYTEPSLTSKLRQGDIFFPKQDISVNDTVSIHDQSSQQLSV